MRALILSLLCLFIASSPVQADEEQKPEFAVRVREFHCSPSIHGEADGRCKATLVATLSDLPRAIASARVKCTVWVKTWRLRDGRYTHEQREIKVEEPLTLETGTYARGELAFVLDVSSVIAPAQKTHISDQQCRVSWTWR